MLVRTASFRCLSHFAKESENYDANKDEAGDENEEDCEKNHREVEKVLRGRVDRRTSSGCQLCWAGLRWRWRRYWEICQQKYVLESVKKESVGSVLPGQKIWQSCTGVGRQTLEQEWQLFVPGSQYCHRLHCCSDPHCCIVFEHETAWTLDAAP